MNLSAGTMLGPYRVTAPLGAGGMGEVYRAWDPRLERDVAIKVLQPSFAADQDQLKRFELEARAVALLNHPNILQVYDLGVQDGAPFIVMELLEGQSLRARMEGRPLGVRRSLEIAVQVARGLGVAHEKKITHRDLKPENLFVEPDGRVKILDFGLAKLLAPPSADSGATQPGRPVTALTQAGSLVGTTGYMAPEQVSGGPVDARTDLFAFGIILFEMLTGEQPFRRPAPVETLHAILKEDPPDLDPALRIPPLVERTLYRCLEKDPRRRFQSAFDLLFNLEGASVPASGVSRSFTLPLPGRGPLPPWARGAAVALGLGLLAGLGFMAGRRSATPPLLGYHRLTYRQGVIHGARFAPDGNSYVFALSTEGRPPELYLGRTDGFGARSLGLPPGTWIQSISRSGEMALLFRKPGSTTGTLAVAPLAGGAPREILEQVYAADWGPDGKDLAVLRAGDRGNYVLEYPLGQPIFEGPVIAPSVVDFPRVSPKGDRVAFLEHQGAGRESLCVVDLRGRRTVLVKGSCDSLQWAPDGRRIYFSYRHTDDRRELRSVDLSGRQQVLDIVLGSLRVQDVSRDGRLLVDQVTRRASLLLRQPPEKGERNLAWLDSSILADLAADGSALLFGEPQEGSLPGGVYFRRTGGADAVRLGDGDPLSLSPDGKWALGVSVDSRKSLWIYPTGAGTPRLLNDAVRADWAVFVEGGRRILLGGVGGDGVFRGYLQDAAGGPCRPWPGRVTPEAYGLPFPAGDRVALGPMDGRLAICALDGRVLQEVGGLKDTEFPVQWEASGRAIFLADLSTLPARILRLDLATGRKTPWLDLSPADRSGVERIHSLALTPDGKTLAYSYLRILASDIYVTDPLP